MLFSQTAEYALRAVVWLADNPDAQRITSVIAQATKIPPDYLSKVIQSLVRGGVLTSKRGIGGGVSLARPASAISVLEVINAVDPIKRICACPLGLPSHGTTLCALHKKLDDSIAQMEAAFGSSTIEDILNKPTASHPLRENAIL